MASPRGLTPFGNKCAKILDYLGYWYEYTAGNGHFVFSHPSQPDFHLSGTSFDSPVVWGKFVSHMRRRHPDSDHPALFLKKTSKPQAIVAAEKKKRAAKRGAKRQEAQVVVPLSREERELLRYPARTSCTASLGFTGCRLCGYRWQSERDPFGQPCPTNIAGVYCPGHIEVPAYNGKRAA